MEQLSNETMLTAEYTRLNINESCKLFPYDSGQFLIGRSTLNTRTHTLEGMAKGIFSPLSLKERVYQWTNISMGHVETCQRPQKASLFRG